MSKTRGEKFRESIKDVPIEELDAMQSDIMYRKNCVEDQIERALYELDEYGTRYDRDWMRRAKYSIKIMKRELSDLTNEKARQNREAKRKAREARKPLEEVKSKLNIYRDLVAEELGEELEKEIWKDAISIFIQDEDQ